MIEIQGNLWNYFNKGVPICITTNGFIKKNGECVMGRGCAREAMKKFPHFPKLLGERLSRLGNNVFVFGFENSVSPSIIFTFPVKHKWMEEADLDLIEKSCIQLVTLVTALDYDEVIVPRPGCGNGKLKWEDVKPVLDKHLDDRFKVITFG